MTIDTIFHDLSNKTKAARICENHGASNMYMYVKPNFQEHRCFGNWTGKLGVLETKDMLCKLTPITNMYTKFGEVQQ